MELNRQMHDFDQSLDNKTLLKILLTHKQMIGLNKFQQPAHDL